MVPKLMALEPSNLEIDMPRKNNLEIQMEALGPWHQKVKIDDGLFTGSKDQKDKSGQIVQLLDTSLTFKFSTNGVFPNGLEGRSFLDCACNAGGYSFAAKDAGAGRVFGFDVRDHWINQANFIKENRRADSSDIEFEVADLLNFAKDGAKFDVTWFSGIFYHLPDPVGALKLAADRTEEVLFLNTACMVQPEDGPENPGLIFKKEGVDALMSGVHHLSWTPTGPVVLSAILNWLGFSEVKTYFWREHTTLNTNNPRQAGRIGLVAARTPGRLQDVAHLGQPNKD